MTEESIQGNPIILMKLHGLTNERFFTSFRMTTSLNNLSN